MKTKVNIYLDSLLLINSNLGIHFDGRKFFDQKPLYTGAGEYQG